MGFLKCIMVINSTDSVITCPVHQSLKYIRCEGLLFHSISYSIMPQGIVDNQEQFTNINTEWLDKVYDTGGYKNSSIVLFTIQDLLVSC